MPRLHPLSAVVVAFGLLSCSESSPTGLPGDGDGDGDGGGDGAGWESVPFVPNPLDVAVSLATAQSVRGIVTPDDGGTIEATGTDGTVYRLVLPPNAVMTETEVTLTPVSAISGYPFQAGMKAGVQFAPEGLRLYEPGLLHITPPSGASSTELTAFAYSGLGEDFHIVPAHRQATVVLRVQHFSGAGLGDATLGERSAQQQRVPRSYESYAQQRVADIVDEALHNCGVSGGCELSDEQIAEFETLLDGWFDLLVEPRLNAARTGGCAETRDAIQHYIAWERQRQLLGFGDGTIMPEALDAFRQGVNNCIREEYQICRTENDVGAVATLIAIAREGELFFGQDIAELAKDRAVKCGRFEMEYEAEIFFYSAGALIFEFHVSATAPIGVVEIDPDLFPPYEGELEILTARAYIEADGCALTEERAPAEPFKVAAFALAPAPLDPLEPDPFWIAIHPGQILYTHILTCEGENIVSDFGWIYDSMAFGLHQGEFYATPDGHVIRVDFDQEQGEFTRGEPYAEKIYTRTFAEDASEVVGDFTFRLLHRPPDLYAGT